MCERREANLCVRDVCEWGRRGSRQVGWQEEEEAAVGNNCSDARVCGGEWGRGVVVVVLCKVEKGIQAGWKEKKVLKPVLIKDVQQRPTQRRDRW